MRKILYFYSSFKIHHHSRSQMTETTGACKLFQMLITLSEKKQALTSVLQRGIKLKRVTSRVLIAISCQQMFKIKGKCF